MEDVDTHEQNKYDEDTMFLCEMCGDDHELLYLDSYLKDVFRGRGVYVVSGEESDRFNKTNG